MNKFSWFIICCILCIAACQSNKVPEGFEADDHYYSVVYEMDNFWNNSNHQPFVLKKDVKSGDVVDSGFQAWDSTFYDSIRKIFLEADISDQKYLGKYNFTEFTDETNNLVTYSYEANDDDLFTRKYLINFDLNYIFDNAYIETKSKKKIQKLLFSPRNVIQFIEQDLTKSPAITTVTTYKF